MRITLTIDDDLANALGALARNSGKPFADEVNEAIRRGLSSGGPRVSRERIRRDSGDFWMSWQSMSSSNALKTMTQRRRPSASGVGCPLQQSKPLAEHRRPSLGRVASVRPPRLRRLAHCLNETVSIAG